MPHGRAWKILKPREFEVRIIPIYFEHAKLSSFIRQANGWDFRRITKGPDRNCYYNPYFLRGIPHLCKKLKRPGIAKKVAFDPDHEPDLYRISELHPVPETYTDDTVLLHCTLQGGPKARMPIYTGFLSPLAAKLEDFKPLPQQQHSENDSKPAAIRTEYCTSSDLTPRDQEVLSAFQTTLKASDIRFSGAQQRATPPAVAAATASVTSSSSVATQDMANLLASSLPASFLPRTALVQPPTLPSLSVLPNLHLHGNGNSLASALAAANQLAFKSQLNQPAFAPTATQPLAFPSSFSTTFPSLQPSFPGNSAAAPASAALSVLSPPPTTTTSGTTASLPNIVTSMFQATASSHFAAGFAAAAAISEQSFQQMLANFSASLTNNGNGTSPGQLQSITSERKTE
jgi:hypothetical protein